MIDQLTLFSEKQAPNSQIEPAESSICNSQIEPPNEYIMRFLNSDKSEGGKGSVNQYLATKNQKLYFRYSYWKENRMHHIHIPGGNVTVRSAIQRADIIKQMVDRGASNPEIIKMIAAFRKP